jgi:hypothetical protein
MTQEEKQLLLQDLCARLPYGVQCSCTWSHEVPNGTIGCIQELSTFLIDEIEIIDNPEYDCQICDVKPYLRPMSSMTEEERKEFFEKWGLDGWNINTFDWLNSHHFDYRGLIEKGLALEAPEGMYK